MLAVNSVISVYYYLGIVQATFVDDEGAVRNVASKPGFGLNLVVLTCALGVFAISFAVTGVQKSLAGSSSSPTVEASTHVGARDLTPADWRYLKVNR